MKEYLNKLVEAELAEYLDAAYGDYGSARDQLQRLVISVEQATLERVAKKFRENAELCADWMEHTKSMYLDGADVLDALKTQGN